MRQRAAGVISLSFGLLVMLLLLLFAVQVAYDLYATSVVTGHAFDAARDTAGYASAEDRSGAARRAEAELIGALGGSGGDVEVSWLDLSEETVALRVQIEHRSILPDFFGPLGLDSVDRTVTVRSEVLR